jgi:uncharacterized GH25 family protein
MNRKVVAGIVGVAVAAFLIWFLALRDKGDDSSTKHAGGPTDRTGLKPRLPVGAGTPEEELRASPRGWDMDPVGGLQLEGQVLDEQDQPVKGADVWLSSTPSRSAKSDDDGTFTFDKLVSRSYAVSARAGDLVGGPVLQQLTSQSPPVVIRLRKGVTLTVHVVTDGDAAPIEGATVELRDKVEQTATTDAGGVAIFAGVSPGWAQVVANAPGYAAGDAGTLISGGAVGVELTLLMRRGAAVSGRVVDEKGDPVMDAYVIRQDAGRWFGASLEKDGVKTSAKGEFTFPVVAAGSYRFLARHASLAPASSQPVTVDGSSETKGVEIVMKAGGAITGVVVVKDGSPAPGAQVTVVARSSVGGPWGGDGGMRKVTADDKGAFEIRGLTRSAMRVRAESDATASAIAEVDLTTKTEVPPLKLVLDITGTIAGVVVDSANQPVAEVQVSAMKDIWSGDNDDLALTGFASATTDGGGAFLVHGLADGEYQVSAHRGGIGMDAQQGWGKKGTTAKTGDTNVRIVLPSPGSIKGTLVLANGDAPKLATVGVAWNKSVPAIDGTFVLDDVAPGSYDLTVRGPEFAERTKADLEVKEGKVTDAGTIKLVRGRRLAGKVVDGKGAPVAGARVRVGKTIFTEGGKAGGDDANLDQLMGHRVATTGADGGFAIVGIAKGQASVVAEHADFGRSDAIKIPAGDSDPPELKLVLHGFGSIAGVVTSKGQPLAAMVMATPKTGGAQFVSVQSGADGAFVIDKVAEGSHRLSATRMGNMSMQSSDSVEVQVKAGERVTANLVIPSGDLTVSIEIKPKAGAKVDAAQVFLFRGVVGAKSVKDLMDEFTGGGANAGGMQFWTGGGPAKFEETLPGRVSVCSIPITGDIRDPQLQQRLDKHSDLLAVYCMGLELPAEPKVQSYPQELPAMNPLPEGN